MMENVFKPVSLDKKKYHDENVKIRIFNKGDLVWRWYPLWAKQKLGFGWRGPYRVIKKISTVTYQIQCCKTDVLVVVHVDHLKPYVSE